ncbi:MAG: hypothetical protein GC129_02740 [Proteobacteria bacterium]|nr:hypothetical protein [Pseudomonadota bacterium]
MALVLRYKFSLAYLLAVLAVCLLFTYWPMIWTLAPGVTFSPWTALVGLWFVLRDYAQREVGSRRVFVPMGLGVALTTLLNLKYALAEGLTGIAGELTDWAIYTYTKKPFYQRVFVSSAISGVVDTVVFFMLFDWLEIVPGVKIFNWFTVLLAVSSKMVAGVYILYLYRKELRRDLQARR